MKYRYANRNEVNEQARKQEALEADVLAYGAWIDALASGIEDPEEIMKSKRAYADKRLVEEECTQADVRQSRQNYLEGWLRQMEERHATMEAKAEVRVENGEDPTPLHREMERLEKFHDLATTELDKLLNETPRAERRARARATKKAVAKKPVAKKAAAKRVSSS